MRQYLIALSAFAVVAGTPVAARDFVVKYDDLNLQSAQGQKELERRIDKSAREYCGLDRQHVGTRIPQKSARNCFASARTAAREQMNTLLGKSQLGG
jgi:UrcA family protein